MKSDYKIELELDGKPLSIVVEADSAQSASDGIMQMAGTTEGKQQILSMAGQGGQSKNESGSDRIEQAKQAGIDILGSVGGMVSPLAFIAVKTGQKIANDPKKAVLQAAEYIPAASGIALPVVAGIASGGTTIPSSLALSGLGMAGGEGYKQIIRRAMGENAAPPLPNPLPFVEGDLDQTKILGIPVNKEMSPEVSNIVNQGATGIANELVGQSLRLLPKIGRGAINAISPSNIKGEAILERYKNPVGVKTALSREQLGNVLVEQHKNLGQQIKVLDDAAKETLNSTPTIPKSDVIEKLKSIKSKAVGSTNKAVTSSSKSSVNAVEDAIEAIEKMNPIPDVKPGITNVPFNTQSGTGGLGKIVGGETGIPGRTGFASKYISEKQLKDLMSQYKDLPWNDPSANAEKQVRNFLDSVLKKNNPSYAESMKPVAERAKIQNIIEKKMSLKYDPTRGTYATDATTGKWTPRLLEGGRPETSTALKRLDKFTGGNILEKAKMTNLKELFEGGKTTGSRMVQLGKHIGGPVGALAGALLDKTGGVITGGMIDALRFASETIGSPLNPLTAASLLKLIASSKADSKNNQELMSISKGLEIRKQKRTNQEK